MKTQQR